MASRITNAVGSMAVLGVVLGLVEGGGLVSGPPSRRTPTYAEDVAPILMNHCVGCHREGKIAPFPLLTYEHARTHAARIKSATEKRQMPPFSLDNSGVCNTYVDARWLSDTEIATIGAWVAGGTPLGDRSKIPPVPPPPPELDRVDLTVDMGTPYTPSTSSDDDYRCFVIDPGLKEDRFVTGFQIHPGEPRMVHHLTLFALDTPEAEREAAKLDEAEPEPGYTCFGDTRVESRWLVGAGPGGRTHTLPEGTGLKMHAGRKTVLQMHYSLTKGRFPDQTTIDLRLVPKVRQEAFIGTIADYELALAPRQREVSHSSMMFVEEPVMVWGVWPHMHLMGTKLKVTANHRGQETCLAQVDDWDFHWQGFANYTKPIPVYENDMMKITCTYDTSSRTTTTRWGSSSEDEMCIAFFYMTSGTEPAP